MTDPPSAPISGCIQLCNTREQIDSIEDLVVEAAQDLGYPRSACFAVRLALEESLVNAFHHGHKTLSKTAPVKVCYCVCHDRITLSIEDQGPGFSPQQVPDPTLDENLETPGGRGLVLMRAYMTSITHNPKGNRVDMELLRPPDDIA